MTNIDWLIVINIILSVGGFAGWCWVWFIGRYQTGKTVKTQIGIILLGLMWVALILSDTTNNFTPSVSTVFGRVQVAIALWLLTPLLKNNDKDD